MYLGGIEIIDRVVRKKYGKGKLIFLRRGFIIKLIIIVDNWV